MADLIVTDQPDDQVPAKLPNLAASKDHPSMGKPKPLDDEGSTVTMTCDEIDQQHETDHEHSDEMSFACAPQGAQLTDAGRGRCSRCRVVRWQHHDAGRFDEHESPDERCRPAVQRVKSRQRDPSAVAPALTGDEPAGGPDGGTRAGDRR